VWLSNKPYATIIKMMEGSLVGFLKYSDFDEYVKNHLKTPEQQNGQPTMADVAKKLAINDGKKLDEKQYIAYKVICCTFLIGILKEAGDDTSSIYVNIARAIKTTEDKTHADKLMESRGGEEQLKLFLTGPAGAGKTTALKAVADQFCYKFCNYSGLPCYETTFFYTAASGMRIPET
jgi:flagellar biosynthesis GTPase FlhF